MLLLLLLSLLIILLIGLYFLFQLAKWIVKKKTRIKGAIVAIVAFSFVSIIKVAFFTKMEFIQSEVYPDLYLIKNPVNDMDSIHKAIEKMVSQKVTTGFIDNKEAGQLSKKWIQGIPYQIRFYQYYTGTSFLVPFGEAGTTHFIKNKEDPGGFTSEELVHYYQYLIAEFNLDHCKQDTLNYTGTLNYYQNSDIIKTETLIHQCLNKSKAPTESAEKVSDSN